MDFLTRFWKTEDIMKFHHLGQKSDFDFSAPNADILESFTMTTRNILVPFLCHEFTSLCPVTGQPDFAKIEVLSFPNEKGIESKSLKLYLNGFRNHGAFHESVIAEIGETIWQKISPKFLRVWGDFHPRGGISIKPLFLRFAEELSAQEKMEIEEKVTQYDRIRKFDW